MSLSSFVSVVHLIGLGLAVGAATVKLILLLKCQRERSFIPIYMKVARPITRQIIAGMVLLTLSGAGWLFLGYPFTPRLIVKLVLVALVWALGPIIDNVVEPKFRALAADAGSPAFGAVERQYLALEIIATMAFYAVIAIWMTR